MNVKRSVEAATAPGGSLAPALEHAASPGPAPDAELFRLHDVSVRLGGRDILQALNLIVPSGRMVGLIGPNGSGKSTLLKVLARQIRPSIGRVDFNGRDQGDYGSRELARTLSYLPQFTPATDGMTVRELVALGRYPWHGPLGRISDHDRAQIDQAIGRTGLTGFTERIVDSLSGGERQRAWLAMLLAQEGCCLLLDEPTSALDIAHQVEVLSLIRDLSDNHALSVMIVLHDVNMAARYCHEIIALSDGRMIARGLPRQIMTTETLERIYGLSMTVIESPTDGAPIGLLG